MTDFLPVAVRAYTPAADPPKRPRHTSWTKPSLVLVIDTETTVDATQRLRFGVWRVYERGELLDEGLFHAEDLPEEDRAFMLDYAGTQPSRLSLRVLSRHEFLNDIFWKVAYKARGLVVGFNLPFDLSRLAVKTGTARGGLHAGGFSLVLWEYEKQGAWQENRYRPRVTIKSIDSKRSLIAFSSRLQPDDEDQIPEDAMDGRPQPGYVFPGHFLDLRALAFALTNESHSLASACRAFGVEHAKQSTDEHGLMTAKYLDYARRDVLATYELLEQLLTEFGRHPIGLAPTRAYSPASIGKSYLQAMGITPPLVRWPDFPREVMGYAMSAYYGGRAECRTRRTPVPVVYLDYVSMYPTSNALMDLWRLVTAESIEVIDATDEVRKLLASVTLEECFDPAFWRRLPCLVQIAPHDDIVPVRARYGVTPSYQIGLNQLAGGEPRWYTLADCVASTLLAGHSPEVLQAWRLVPRGTTGGLQPVQLRGQVAVYPATEDFFRSVIELRKTLPEELSTGERARLGGFLKVLANSTSYGIYAEMNRQELNVRETREVTVYGLDAEPFNCRISVIEEPGRYCFPPFATFIAGAARLMLALLERSVTDLGGTYAMCDTDSMAIVATEHGGLVRCPGGPERLRRKEAIRAVSWDEVEWIRQRFAALNPYDHERIPGSVLRLEDVNLDGDGKQRQLWCHAISAKRYALNSLNGQGEPTLEKWSEHGLGHLLNPTNPDSDDRDWMRQVWEWIVRDELDVETAEPAWLDRPAISRLTVSSPELLRPFDQLNGSLPYSDQVKPFNFMIAAHVRRFGHPEGVDPERFHLVAPFELDPGKWETVRWIDRYSGQPYQISAAIHLHRPDVALVKTMRDVLAEFRTHPEAKSADRLGGRTGRQTIGLLQRRAVQETFISHVGKESNRLEEVEAGLFHETNAARTDYAHPTRNEWTRSILSQLARLPIAHLAAETGMSERAVRSVLQGKSVPHDSNREAYVEALRGWIIEHLLDL